MQIEFYEEFPTQKNLGKLNFIKFKTRIFIAAKSLEKFQELEKQVKKINKKATCGYWPIIKNSYWISPFSNAQDLKALFKELDKCKNQILIDLELPIKKGKLLLIKNLFNLRKNKKLIKQFLEQHKKQITTAQFPVSLSKINRVLGLDYNIKTDKSLMWYSSIVPDAINNKIKKQLKNIEDKDQYSISLGTIARGVWGCEPILPPEQLKRDLEFVKQAGFNKVIIFRLGGLNKEYMKIVDKFQRK